MTTQGITTRKYKKKKDHTRLRFWVFFAALLLLLFAAVFARKLCPYDPDLQDMAASLQAPGKIHLAGTDRFGRDMFSRILMGLQTSLLSTLSLVAIISVFGSAVGILCGYFGGWIDALVMRISDICLAFPGLVFALAIAALLNGGLVSAVFALAVVSWPKFARIARSQTLALKNATYVAAAKMAGDSAMQIICRHILPNALGTIFVTAMLDVGTMLMELSGLSFLGLGAQPPTAELGNMMSSGRSMLQTYPWVVLGPGIAIFIAVVILNLFGDAVRDYLDPKSSRSK